MSTQIFKSEIPSNLLFNLLDKICMKNEKHYLLNNESFKKGLFDNSIQEFVEKCKTYYHKSKLHYLERKLSYNTFITIIRQICNFSKLIYTSQIRYSNSKYDIVYIIYYKN
jgi:hypothetical protein